MSDIGYTTYGTGPAGVIVLHRWMGDHTVFGTIFSYLHETALTYAFMDYRGYGGSKDLDGEYSIAEIAADARRTQIINGGTGLRLSSNWVNWMVKRSRETSSVEAFAGYTAAWVETHFADAPQGKGVPVLAVVGSHDPVITEALMRNTIAKWMDNVTIRVIEVAGHYPMQETPVYMITLAEAFFNANGQT